MNTKIYLKGVRAYGYVGLLPEENVLGQWFEVDATLWVDFEAATYSDQIADTYDYRQSIQIIETTIKTAKFALVERLAGAIADQLLADPKVEQVQIRLIKHPPIPEFQGAIVVELVRSAKQEPPHSNSKLAKQPVQQTAKQIIEIYTDGACSGNPGAGGWASLICFSDGTQTELCGRSSHTTNNQMEMQAAIAALEFLNQHLIQYPQPQVIPLFTDSKYLIDGVSKWIKNWKRNNWQTSTKQAVKNQELWQALDALLTQVKVEWRWVAGHSGNPGNERCDLLARNQIGQAR
ncbi:MAG: ribonuclease HI [Pseudanabaenaceae cyanobacterium bins.68]|nr:ribonuclease HI [Pseudanabaenaceae cyanobacterium bins.68]